MNINSFLCAEIRFSCFTVGFNLKRYITPISVASPGFFRGGTPRPLKGYHAPPAEGPGGEGPRTVAKFHFLKRFQNELIFQKCQHFSSPKDPFFSKKNLGKLNIFYKNFWIFSKNYFKFSLFMIPYKSREILCEF